SGTTSRRTTWIPPRSSAPVTAGPERSSRVPRATPSLTVTTAAACRVSSGIGGARLPEPRGGVRRRGISLGGHVPAPSLVAERRAHSGPARRPVRPGRRRPARLGDGSVQLPLHVLHARRGAAVVAEAGGPHVRGD